MAKQNHSIKLKIKPLPLPLDEAAWYYNKYLSEEYEEPVFIHRFPVYKYNKTTLLEGEFILYKDRTKIKINVIDRADGTLYTPFYIYEYGNYEPLLKIINKNIKQEIKKLGITELHTKRKETDK